MTNVSRPVPTAMALAMRVPSTRRSNDVAQQSRHRQDARIHRRRFPQHRRQRRRRRRGRARSAPPARIRPPPAADTVPSVGRTDPDRVRVAGDADDRGLRLRSRKPRPSTSSDPYIAIGQVPADDHGGRRIVAGLKRSAKQERDPHDLEERRLDADSTPLPAPAHRRRYCRGPGRRAAAPTRGPVPRLRGAARRAPSPYSSRRSRRTLSKPYRPSRARAPRPARTRSRDRPRARVAACASSSPRAPGSGSCPHTCAAIMKRRSRALSRLIETCWPPSLIAAINSCRATFHAGTAPITSSAMTLRTDADDNRPPVRRKADVVGHPADRRRSCPPPTPPA